MPTVSSKKLTQVEDKSSVSNSFEDVFNEFINDIIDEDVEVDILTFIESPYYLNIKTLQHPQRFIFKIFYHLPLDNTVKCIRIRNFPHDCKGQLLTEREYANFLINQKRTNLIGTDDIEFATELLLACGRRGGKTFIASIISAYESYKLIIKDNPQAHYDMAEDEMIRIVNVASSGDQAQELATQIQNRIFNCEWFLPYIASYNGQEINLKTKHDISKMKAEQERYGKPLKKRASVCIESLLCSARRARGGSIIVALLDELAHFIDNEGNRGGKTIYNSLTPSGATFGNDSKIICISSPYSKSGVFFDLYTQSFEDQSIRMLQMPTWEMNPRIEFSWLQNRYKKDPDAFWTEYGAQFSTKVSGFFKFPEKIYECVDVVRYDDGYDEDGNAKKIPIYREPTDRMTTRNRYYIALDPATVDNGYALAMVHLERDATGRSTVVVDRWMKWSVNDPEFAEFDFIDIEYVDNYVMDLTKKFKVVKIVYDQFESAASIQKFIKARIDAVKTHFSRQYNMKIYRRLRSIIYDRKISLLYHEEGLRELVYLQEKKVGKRQFKVEAPKSGDVTTDDMADVLANAVNICCENELMMPTPNMTRAMAASSGPTVGSKAVTLALRTRRSNTVRSLQYGASNIDRMIVARRLGIHR